jgi:hypothetical protein
MENKIEESNLKKRLYFNYIEDNDSVKVVVYKGITQRDIDIMKDDTKYSNKTIEFDLSKEKIKTTSLPVTKIDNYTGFGKIIKFDISEDMIQEWFNKLDNE